MAGRVMAGLAAFTVLLVFLLGSLALVRIVLGLPFDGSGEEPEWEIWVLVAGGGLGAGAARWAHHSILTRVLRASEADEERAWRSRR